MWQETYKHQMTEDKGDIQYPRMEADLQKLYHVHGFHSRTFLNDYFSSSSEIADDSARLITEKFHSAFSTGDIKGDLLIDLSTGPVIHHLYSACEYFKDVILLRLSEHCILELKRWLGTRTGAFDWSHTSTIATELARKSGQFLDKETQLKAAISHVVKCDLSKENITEPLVLPPADCLVSISILETVSKDRDDYVKNLRCISKLLKPSGHIVYFGPLGATYFTVGDERFSLFKNDESHLRSALSNVGFVVTYLEILQKTANTDLADHEHIVFFIAYKAK